VRGSAGKLRKEALRMSQSFATTGLGRLVAGRWTVWTSAAVLSLLLAGAGYKYARKVLTVRPGHTVLDRGALARWLPQLQELQAGVNIFQRHQYPNPPIMALFLLPLANLPPLGASLAWFAIKAVLTVVALAWLFRWVGACRSNPLVPDCQPFPLWAQGLTILLSLRPILGDLDHGNINLFILFLVLAALTAFHWRRDVLAGLMLGLAIACKLTPALFIPYFVWKRSWRTLAGCSVGLALFLWPGFVPTLYFGWQPNQDYVQSWYRDMVRPFVIEGKVTSERSNQSLPGVVFRLTTANPAESEWDEDQQRFVPVRVANLLSLDPAVARALIKGCMGVFALLVVWSCRTSLVGAGGWRLSAEFSLIVLGMLLFSERTWKHHCVTLVLPFAVLSFVLATQAVGRPMCGYLAATLAGATLLIAATSNGLVPERLAEAAQIYGAYVAAEFLLLAALVVLLRRRAPSSICLPAGLSSTP
jgi:hypothetical protein